MAVQPQEISQEEYNKRVTAWGSVLGTKLRTSIRSLTTKGKGDLLRSLRLKTGKWFGEVDKLSYHFERHGIFAHKGVGRGYKMVGGKVIRASIPGSFITKNDEGKITGRVLKAGPVGLFEDSKVLRKPAEWFNPVVNENIEGLADIIAEMDADRMVNATKILIK